MAFVKKQRDPCVVLLDDCFDCGSAASKLTDAGFCVRRFTELFPASANPAKREQNVKDDRVIKLCHARGFLLFTTDKSMREAHALALLETTIAVVATASNNDEDAVELWIEQRGFVLNERPGDYKVHHASCEAVSATTVYHPKYYSRDRRTAKDWLDRRFGTDGWKNCGMCSGLDSSLA